MPWSTTHEAIVMDRIKSKPDGVITIRAGRGRPKRHKPPVVTKPSDGKIGETSADSIGPAAKEAIGTGDDLDDASTPSSQESMDDDAPASTLIPASALRERGFTTPAAMTKPVKRTRFESPQGIKREPVESEDPAGIAVKISRTQEGAMNSVEDYAGLVIVPDVQHENRIVEIKKLMTMGVFVPCLKRTFP